MLTTVKTMHMVLDLLVLKLSLEEWGSIQLGQLTTLFSDA
jgi:hypothetical protein